MRVEDKARLDRLQAELTARRGRKVTQTELLRELVRLGEREKTRLLAPPGKPSERALKRLMALPVDAGVDTREEDVDRALYGEPA
jgi:hypothetical protein